MILLLCGVGPPALISSHPRWVVVMRWVVGTEPASPEEAAGVQYAVLSTVHTFN